MVFCHTLLRLRNLHENCSCLSLAMSLAIPSLQEVEYRCALGSGNKTGLGPEHVPMAVSPGVQERLGSCLDILQPPRKQRTWLASCKGCQK